MQHYHSVLGGELTLSTFREMGGTGMDVSELDKVMHGRLVTPDGLVLMGADTPDSMDCSPGGCSVSLSGDDEARAGRLTRPGRATQPRPARR